MMDQKQLSKLIARAKDGFRITFLAEGCEKAKTLWAGLGNRSGLHSFAYTLLSEKYAKSGERFEKKLASLGAGKVTVHAFRNVTRDRGRWSPVAHITVK